MAESASAPAQPSARPMSPSSDLDDLALQTCDDADSLNDVMRAYAAFEKLVDTSVVSDSEDLATTRTELSALLRLLNEALTSRIDAVNAAAAALRTALQLKSCTP